MKTSEAIKQQCEKILKAPTIRTEHTNNPSVILCVLLRGIIFVDLTTGKQVHPSEGLIRGGTEALIEVKKKSRKRKPKIVL